MFGTVLLLVINALMAVLGWRYLFRTDAVVAAARARHEKKRLQRNSLSPGMVTESWYPTYVRCAGVALWLCDLFLVYFVWFWTPPR